MVAQSALLLRDVIRHEAKPLVGAVIHFDETRAVEPLERTSEWDVGEVPETFPTGI